MLPRFESKTVEFKQEFPKGNQIVKTVVAFSNTMGGSIYIGIKDDGVVLGLSVKEAASLMEKLPKMIFDSITPPVFPSITLKIINDKNVLIVSVSQGIQLPYFISNHGMTNGCFVRVGSSTIKANPETIAELQLRGRGITSDAIPVYNSSVDDLDLNLFKEFVVENKRKKVSINISKKLEEYRMVFDEHNRTYCTRAGLLLFGKNPRNLIPESYIMINHFKGKQGRESIAGIDCIGTLYNQILTAENFIFSRLNKSFVINSLKREEVLEIPEVAIREVLVNAIMHRNYSVNSSIKIAIYDDRIEFFSPGTLPGIFDVADLEQGISVIRNSIIARVLREMGFAEKLGTGFLTIFKAFKKRGLLKPEIIVGSTYVKVILFRPTKTIAVNPSRVDISNSLEKQVLEFINRRQKVATKEVCQEYNISKATAIRAFNSLLENNLIERIGRGKATRYVPMK